MCGRYSFVPDKQQLIHLFDGIEIPEQLELSFNIAPTQSGWIITNQAPLLLQRSTWGLVPAFEKAKSPQGKHINARAETVETSPLFSESFRKNRCIVLADSFYEWKVVSHRQKQPFRILRKDAQLLCFAGIYTETKSIVGDVMKTYAIITCPPNQEMAGVHNRMPVILNDITAFTAWLSNTDTHILKELLVPAPDHTLRLYPVSHLLGNTQINSSFLHEEAPVIRTLFD